MGNHTTPPLKAVTNDQDLTAWCGPTVVCGITGKPMSEIKALIKVYRGENVGVAGTDEHELRYALEICGFYMGYPQRFRKAERPTFAEWLRTRKPEDVSKTYIVDVSFGMASGGLWARRPYERGHWVVVRGRKALDTFTKGEPVNLSDAPHRRKRVRAVYVVTRQTEQQKLVSEIKRARAKSGVRKLLGPKKDPLAKSKAAFRREIKRLGGNVEYDSHRGSYITIFVTSNRVCTKWSEWDSETFDRGNFWQEAADFLKDLKPSDFKVQFRLNKAA